MVWIIIFLQGFSDDILAACCLFHTALGFSQYYAVEVSIYAKENWGKIRKARMVLGPEYKSQSWDALCVVASGIAVPSALHTHSENIFVFPLNIVMPHKKAWAWGSQQHGFGVEYEPFWCFPLITIWVSLLLSIWNDSSYSSYLCCPIP